MRRIGTAALLLACALLVQSTAAEGKSGSAWLMTPIPLDAEPATTIRVAWVIRGDDGSPFNAASVFVRLLSASGAPATEGFASATAHETGEYEADVAVPAGGIASIEIGVAGTMSGPGVPARRSDGLFAIANAVRTESAIMPGGEPPSIGRMGELRRSQDLTALFAIAVLIGAAGFAVLWGVRAASRPDRRIY